MTDQNKETIEQGIKGYLFPIVMSALGFVLTFTTYNIAKSLNAIESEILNMKIDQRDTIKDMQYLNLRLSKIEEDIKLIKKNLEERD